VAASFQAPVLFTIAQDLRAMEVHTNVAEADIGKLRAGMDAGFTVDAYPGERFAGRIREIRNAPQVVQNVVTYDAVIDVPNPELKLKPGMTATVTVIADRREGVLRLPGAALRFRPDAAGGGGPAAGGSQGPRPGAGRRPPGDGGRVVWVLENGKPVSRTVRLGLSDGTFTELVGGELKEGDAVITGVEGVANAGSGRPRGMRGGMRIL
jgi:HlyD family secretion protein